MLKTTKKKIMKFKVKHRMRNIVRKHTTETQREKRMKIKLFVPLSKPWS